jgi:hypothetical protein
VTLNGQTAIETASSVGPTATSIAQRTCTWSGSTTTTLTPASASPTAFAGYQGQCAVSATSVTSGSSATTTSSATVRGASPVSAVRRH